MKWGHLDCFDGVTFWMWTDEDQRNMDSNIEKVFVLVKDKPLMLEMLRNI